MSRNFKDFLTAYEAFADNDFLPKRFHTWAALSVIAGALERRVWLPWTHNFSFFPNIYVLLLSKPGLGKSSSMNISQELLEAVYKKTNSLNILPPQVSLARFVELVGRGKEFRFKHEQQEPDGSSKIVEVKTIQSAAYYYASEARNSLNNEVFGDIIACFTDFYDCPPRFARSTKKDGTIRLENVCVNLLAGSTFDYLDDLIGGNSIMGGFASRLLYVAEWDRPVKKQKFQQGLRRKKESEQYRLYEKALVEDLLQIHSMVGPMSGTDEMGAAWEDWNEKFQERIEGMPDKLEHTLVRTSPSVIKIAMLLSASESNDFIIKLHHLEKAIALVESTIKDIPRIFETAKAASGPKAGGASLAASILKRVRNKSCTDADIRSALNQEGFRPQEINEMLKSLIHSKALLSGDVVAGRGMLLRINEDAHADF